MRSAPWLLLVALAGCNLAPPHERPPMPTASTYREEDTEATAGGRSAPTLGWHEFFADTRLETLIETALERNRDLRVAVAQIEEARGLYRIQRSERFPSIDASGSAVRSRQGPESLATGRPGSFSSDPITFERYTVEAAISAFELDFWGRVRNLSNAARAEYLGTIEAARSFRLSLIREVSNAYLASLEAGERMALAEATVKSRQEGLRIAKRRLDAGVTSALDFRQSESLLTQAEAELASLRLAKAQSDNLLTVLVGGPIVGPLPEPLPLAKQMSSQAVAPGLPSELLVARPDIAAAEERLKAARANVGAARAAFFPSIALTGGYGYASTQLDTLFGDDGLTWNYGVTLAMPIFNVGRTRGNLDVAKARENIAVATYEKTIQTGFQEVADALAGRRYLAEQVAAQERNTIAQRRIADLARTRYREGVVDYLQVLDAERNLFSAEQTLLQVRRAEIANLVSLYVALGGGTLD
jgi:multidrug efflux system outer membrane protein